MTTRTGADGARGSVLMVRAGGGDWHVSVLHPARPLRGAAVSEREALSLALAALRQIGQDAAASAAYGPNPSAVVVVERCAEASLVLRRMIEERPAY